MNMRSILTWTACLACTLMLLGVPSALAGLAGARPNQAGFMPGTVQDSLACQCTDIDPRISFVEPANYTCWQQYKFGKCGGEFLKTQMPEIPEGYCQISCGQCDCCPSLAKAAESAGLTEFLWAVNHTGGSSGIEDLSQPGLMATLLAPNDGAMRDLFDKLGGKEAIQSNSGVAGKLGDILKLHYLPPVPVWESVWTAPFFLPNTTLPSLKADTPLKVVDSSDGVRLQAPKSSAKVNKPDIYACKGFIQELDAALLPYDVNQR